MEKNVLEKISKLIYKQYPVIQGQTPAVSKQANNQYLLIFTAHGKTPDGMTIEHKIRVVATEDGQILKTSTSR